MQLLRAREAAMSRFRPMLREHGLTEQQWRVIRALSGSTGMGAGDLAKRSFLLSPSLTRILRHLESRGIIKRSGDASDLRRSLFCLTARGRRLFAAVAPDSEHLYAAIEAEFGAARLARLYALLAEFRATLDGETGSADPA